MERETFAKPGDASCPPQRVWSARGDPLGGGGLDTRQPVLCGFSVSHGRQTQGFLRPSRFPGGSQTKALRQAV